MITVYGPVVDSQGRCKHYHTMKDIVAVKFKCCNKYYPCYKCHDECEDHPVTVWKREEFSEAAILCGVCRTEYTIHRYLQMNRCNCCGSRWNEGCQKHYHLYFQFEEDGCRL
ncbi:CHY zinc finger protein [Kroppenstedtia guangzhouensis]|uniref:CHY zinc finger protein n=1 Tax=Kroppenstedtia guangzhouensis TaxID=1274356 RepID=UPI00166CD573|nr:CHY zinc finger protein [Kroppenstedtia guangzhouensis]